MKKFNILFLSVLLALTACNGCNGDAKPDTPAEADTTAVKPPEGQDPGGETPEPPVTPPATVVYHQRAKEMFDLVNSLYRITPADEASLYREELGGSAYSFLWPFDGMISGITALQRLGYEVNYEAMVDNFEKYLMAANVAGTEKIPAYGSSTNGYTGGSTRYYDDNSIVGIELVDAYRITKQQKYLDRCKTVFNFLEKGLDNIMGEALWWNEDQKGLPPAGTPDNQKGNYNKPACANGYACNFLLNYYSICPEADREAVLSFAKKLYTWLKTNLQDPDDKTYWNDKNATGAINKTKWTYNSGVMILNGILLFQITGDDEYLAEAKATADGAYGYFVKWYGNRNFSYPDHDPWFNTKLLKAYIALKPLHAEAAKYVDRYVSYIEYAYKNARYPNGLFYEDWTGTKANPVRDNSLLHQAAVIESYGLIALDKGETSTME